MTGKLGTTVSSVYCTTITAAAPHFGRPLRQRGKLLKLQAPAATPTLPPSITSINRIIALPRLFTAFGK